MANKPLNNKQLRCIELMITTEMQKQEIASELGIRRETISAWVKREDFQAAMRDEMQREFSQMALKARRKLNELVDSNNPQVALAAAKEVLNKAGYQETQNINQTITTDITVEIEE
jgi:uncharacterized protein YjcR